MDDTTSQAEVAACRKAHRQAHDRMAGAGDAVLRRPSRLPGWTIGHVLTHLARNADSVVRRLDAARAGELVEQYPGGASGRAAEIESGAEQSADDVLADLPQRAGGHALVAWATGRGPAPVLPPWG